VPRGVLLFAVCSQVTLNRVDRSKTANSKHSNKHAARYVFAGDKSSAVRLT